MTKSRLLGNKSITAYDLENEELALVQAAIESHSPYTFSQVIEADTLLIHEDYFEAYAEQLARDLDLLNGTIDWPFNCIDWEQAATELKQKYYSFDVDNPHGHSTETYWFEKF